MPHQLMNPHAQLNPAELENTEKGPPEPYQEEAKALER